MESLLNLENLPPSQRKIAARLLLRMGYDLHSKHVGAYEHNLSTLLQLFPLGRSDLEAYRLYNQLEYLMNDSDEMELNSYQPRKSSDFFVNDRDEDIYHNPYELEPSYIHQILNQYNDDDFKKYLEIQAIKAKKHSYTNALFKFPFVDNQGTVKDALNQVYETTRFIDINSVSLQRRLAKQVYEELSIGRSKMRLIDVLKGLEVCTYVHYSIISNNNFFLSSFIFY